MRNRARCRRCKDVVESLHRHDFVPCGCGAIFVDGGTEYLRAGFIRPDDFEMMGEDDE